MLNARPIDKFYLSGGWQNVPLDAAMLKRENVRAVLDLQYTSDDDPSAPLYVKGELAKVDIEYEFILMRDGDGDAAPQNLPFIFNWGAGILTGWNLRFTDPKDRILVKCGSGISRSSAMLIAAYGYMRQWSYQQSLTYIRNKEQNAPSLFMQSSPNPVFADYLKKVFGYDEYRYDPDATPGLIKA